MSTQLQVYRDVSELARAASEEIVKIVGESIAGRGVCFIALSGGATPKTLYQELATAKNANQIDWSKVHLFWSDERCVPPDSPESNYRMARESLIDHIAIPDHNVHRIHGELAPEDAADEYEITLKDVFNHQHERVDLLPRFDLMLLGLGEDGHTASLFPDSLALQEQVKWVAANYVQKLNAWRVTLTFPVINNARRIVFLVAGSGKSDALQAVLAPTGDDCGLPARLVRPVDGLVTWMIGQDARQGLR